MKKLVLIIFALLISCSIYGQSGNSVNLRSIIKEQIEHAKSKKIRTEKTVSKPVFKIKKLSKSNADNSFISNDLLFRIFILIEASFIAAMVVIIRRRLLAGKTVAKGSLKDNIKRLREEKIEITTDKDVTQKRRKLGKYVSEEVSKLNITELAKKLSVSKGEIHLAAKMKLLAQK